MTKEIEIAAKAEQIKIYAAIKELKLDPKEFKVWIGIVRDNMARFYIYDRVVNRTYVFTPAIRRGEGTVQVLIPPGAPIAKFTLLYSGELYPFLGSMVLNFRGVINGR